MEPDVLSGGDIQLLTALGFAAAGAGLWRYATQIFEGLTTLRPYRAFPYIGQAVVLLNRQLPNEAAGVLEQGQRVLGGSSSQDRSQEIGELQGWHGLALHLAGRSHESRLELQQAYRLGAALNSASMVAAMLGEMPRPLGAVHSGDQP